MCPKSKLPFGIIVFDEHRLFVNVIQGMFLSTASMVLCLRLLHVDYIHNQCTQMTHFQLSPYFRFGRENRSMPRWIVTKKGAEALGGRGTTGRRGTTGWLVIREAESWTPASRPPRPTSTTSRAETPGCSWGGRTQRLLQWTLQCDLIHLHI